MERVFVTFFYKYTAGTNRFIFWLIDVTAEPAILSCLVLIPRPLAYLHVSGWFLRPFDELLPCFSLQNTALGGAGLLNYNPYLNSLLSLVRFFLTPAPGSLALGGAPLFSSFTTSMVGGFSSITTFVGSGFSAYSALRKPTPFSIFFGALSEQVAVIVASSCTVVSPCFSFFTCSRVAVSFINFFLDLGAAL